MICDQNSQPAIGAQVQQNAVECLNFSDAQTGCELVEQQDSVAPASARAISRRRCLPNGNAAAALS
jgi:hypothetical protein